MFIQKWEENAQQVTTLIPCPLAWAQKGKESQLQEQVEMLRHYILPSPKYIISKFYAIRGIHESIHPFFLLLPPGIFQPAFWANSEDHCHLPHRLVNVQLMHGVRRTPSFQRLCSMPLLCFFFTPIKLCNKLIFSLLKYTIVFMYEVRRGI